MHAHLGLLLLSLAMASCAADTDTPDPVLTPGFQVVSPEVTIMPGEEITYCYYFRTPNTEDQVIAKWSSVMTPGSHHMIMYTTTTDTMPPGTLSSSSCGGFSAGNIPSWTYSAQTPTNEAALPADDGNGLPLGQDISAGTPAYFQMHYLNATDTPIQAHVTLDAEALPGGTAYTRTAPYVTYNASLSIPPGATDHVEAMTCSVPDGAKFWALSTHSHKQSVTTTVKDGTAASPQVAFTSTDWEHPDARTWMSAPFHTFTTNQLTYECTYDNIGTNAATTVVSGPSAQTNEMCMAIGYYFPASKALICLNELGPF